VGEHVSEILRIPVDRELSERVRWLVRVRWVVAPALALVTFALNRVLGGSLPLASILWVCLGILLYNGVFWVLSNRLVGRSAPQQAQAHVMHGQILTDLVALTVVLHFTGGIENPFSMYYVILVVIGSILMTRKSANVYCFVASGLWVGLLVLEATGVLPHHNLQGYRSPERYHQLSHLVSEALVIITATFASAQLVSHIIERMRQGENQLYGANMSCELRAAELSRLNQKLRDYEETRSMFIRVVTHELRAPVAAIQSYLQLIVEGYVPPERHMEIIHKAERRARDQLDLIVDLLDLTRAGSLVDEAVKPCDPAEVLRDVVDMFSARATEKALQVQVRVAKRVPRAAINAEHMKQIWVNLISNACKYTPEGGQVWIDLDADDEMVRGSVRDTGIGIALEDQAKVFENFYRTDEAKAMARDGTGLGLSIVTQIMRRYKGEVWFESVEGKGSTFFFRVPVAAKAHREAA